LTQTVCGKLVDLTQQVVLRHQFVEVEGVKTGFYGLSLRPIKEANSILESMG